MKLPLLIAGLAVVGAVAAPPAQADDPWIAEAYAPPSNGQVQIAWVTSYDRSWAEQQAVNNCHTDYGVDCTLAGSTIRCMIVSFTGQDVFVGYGPTRQAAGDDAGRQGIAFYHLPADATATVDLSTAHCSTDTS